MKQVYIEYLLVVLGILVGLCVIGYIFSEKGYLPFMTKGTTIQGLPDKENLTEKSMAAAKENRYPKIEAESIKVRQDEGSGKLSDNTPYLTRQDIIERAKIKVPAYDDSNREVSSEEYRIYPYDEVKNISQKKKSDSLTGSKRKIITTDEIGEYSIRIYIEDKNGLISSKNILVLVDSKKAEKAGDGS